MGVAPNTLNASNFRKQAIEAYEAGEYEESARLFVAALAQQGEFKDPLLFYDTACALSMAARTNEAFDYLELALKYGYHRNDRLATDSDLDNLRSLERWSSIVERAEGASKAYETLWSNSVWKAPYNKDLDPALKVAGLSRFWSVAKYNFVFFDQVPDLDWDALYIEYLTRVQQTSSTLEYYRELMRLCALLQDGHTKIRLPRELYDSVYRRPLLRTRRVEGKAVVIAVYDKKLPIELGMEITAVDGKSLDTYVEENVAPYQSWSTPQDRDVRVYDYGFLSGPLNRTVSLQLVGADGNATQVELSRVSWEKRREAIPERPPFEFRVLPGNIGLVTLNTFNKVETPDEFMAAFNDISQTDALIMDVRNNGGGNSGNGYRILATLTDKPSSRSVWATRAYRPAYRAWGRSEATFKREASTIDPDGERLYTKPVVVLTSARTYSAAEDFCVAFREMKRGTIIGAATGGSTGQPLTIDLPGGGKAQVCSKRDTYSDGTAFVGVGVLPDIEARVTIESIRSRRDIVLERAIEEIKLQLSSSK